MAESAASNYSSASIYPRPDFDRSHAWQSLDGDWDFAPDPEGAGFRQRWHVPGKRTWSESIQVPFPWESPRSGIHREWLPIGWYHRHLQRPHEWADLRTILHVGAAHYHTTVWIEGLRVGEHSGGYLPFAFDITDWLKQGEGEVIIRVEAPLDKRYLPHGKQRSKPADDYDDCAFTASSGIWQPVWWEARPATYIEQIQLRPDSALDGIEAQLTLQGTQLANAKVALQVCDDQGSEVGYAGQKEIVLAGQGQVAMKIPLPDPQLWSPHAPHLYWVTVTLQSPDGEDRATAYTGLRKIEVRGEQIYLNDRPLFVRGALDQGFWPDTIYTAPDDDALKRDVELALAAGYNLIRKHIKLENPRWLYWADRLGLLVWEEPPCIGRYTPAGLFDFEAQLQPMIARDGNHPSIIIWGIYNEEWGLDWESHSDPGRQAAVERAYWMVKQADPTRLVVDDSGWWHVNTDLVDWHYYDMDMQGWCANTRTLAADNDAWSGISRPSINFDRVKLSVPGRSQRGKPILNGEYGGGSPENQGWIFRWQTADLRRYPRFCGYIYTELYDVEHEIVGIYTAERKLKDLGCHPTLFNTETVIIFDHVPLKPGLDYHAPLGLVAVDVLVSHHGERQMTAQLHWGWEENSLSSDHQVVDLHPFAVTAAIPLGISLPDNQPTARLHVWLVDDTACRVAYNFMDVALLTTPLHSIPM